MSVRSDLQFPDSPVRPWMAASIAGTFLLGFQMDDQSIFPSMFEDLGGKTRFEDPRTSPNVLGSEMQRQIR